MAVSLFCKCKFYSVAMRCLKPDEVFSDSYFLTYYVRIENVMGKTNTVESFSLKVD